MNLTKKNKKITVNLAINYGSKDEIVYALKKIKNSLRLKSDEFSKIVKIGRTHLMDATPLTLGQVFSGYAQQIKNSIHKIFKW